MRGDVARLLEDLAATRARLSQERTRSEELAQDLAQERARVGALEGRLSQERARGAALEGEVQRVRAGGGGDADMAAVLAEVVKRVVGDVTKGTREEGTREDRREGGQRLLSVEDLFAPSSSLDAATRRRRCGAAKRAVRSRVQRR